MQATKQSAPPSIAQSWKQTKIILEMIKFEHTVFMLPFALMAAVVAAKGQWHLLWLKGMWILAAMVSARSAAMAFNRVVDRHIDKANPRTSTRAIPAGVLPAEQVIVFTLVSTVLFVFSAAMLNRLALDLAPLALLLIFGYSYTKRVTAWSHFFLGLALASAPVGASVAILGAISPFSLWLGAAVVCWLFGFDIIYSLQDLDFDRANGLHSMPVLLGSRRALFASRSSHVLMVPLLVLAGVSAHLHVLYYVGVAVTAVLIAYEQSLVKYNDLSKLNLAFFTLNGYISVALFLFTLGSVLV